MRKEWNGGDLNTENDIAWLTLKIRLRKIWIWGIVSCGFAVH